MEDDLRLIIRVLVACRGRQPVLEALASTEDVDVASIERDVEQVLRSTKTKTAPKGAPRKRKSAYELVRATTLGQSVRPLIERLAHAYEAKEFLPDLWRVKQFLELHGVEASRARSRGDALPKVVRVLSGLPSDKLQQLVDESSDTRSDLSILTDHIMGPAQGSRSSQT